VNILEPKKNAVALDAAKADDDRSRKKDEE